MSIKTRQYNYRCHTYNALTVLQLIAISLAVWLSQLLGPPQCLAADEPHGPLRIEDALKTKTLGGLAPISVSPDGQWVAYTVRDASKQRTETDPRYADFTRTGTFSEAVGSDVWVTNIKTKATEKLGTPTTTSWDPVWSPDGKFIAFYSDRDGFARLWLWELATHRFRELSPEIVRPFFNFQVVRWTPDGRKIVLKVVPEGKTIEQAAEAYAESKESTEAERTSSGEVTSAVVYENLPKAHGTTDNTDTSDTASSNPVAKSSPSHQDKRLENDKWMNRYSADLAVVDVQSGKLERIATHARPMSYWISSDGKYLAYTNHIGCRPNTQSQVYQIVLVNLFEHSSRVLAPYLEQDYGNALSWSPDSSSIAYINRDAKAVAHCYVVRIAEGSQPRDWTPDTPSFTAMWDDSGFRPPAWDPASEHVYLIGNPDATQTNKIWKASAHGCQFAGKIQHKLIHEFTTINTTSQLWLPGDHHSLVVSTQDQETKQDGFYKINIETGVATKLFEENAAFGSIIFDLDVSRNEQTVAYFRQSVSEPCDVWAAGSDLTDRERISEVNPEISRAAFGKSRLLEYRSLDGTPLRGALLLPARYEEGQRYPLVVYVYGGENLSSSLNHFGVVGAGVDNMQLLASRGYAVLLPDTPVKKGSPMFDLLKTVLPAVDCTVGLGIADPDRIGVMGHSYGGYSTMALIVQTTRFRAAVASAPMADLISGYGTLSSTGSSNDIGWCESGQGGMEGTPWQFRDRYIENSPIFYLDRVRTPLLVVQGADDPLFHHQQAEEIFVGLRRLGQEVSYAKYLGEGHWPGSWGYANEVDYCNRFIAWFDKHLKNTDALAKHDR